MFELLAPMRTLPGGLLAATEVADARGNIRDVRSIIVLGLVILVLGLAHFVTQYLRRQPESSINPAVVQRFSLRLRSWWMMCVILAAGFLMGREATVILFFGVSFWALREFITLTPTRLSDHRTLFWVFFLFTPLQYVLIVVNKIGPDISLVGFYSTLIPVYAFLFIPTRIALAGDYRRFLERTAKIQTGLMISVFALSHAPALLYLEVEKPSSTGPFGLLFFLVLVVQLADVLQYTWDKVFGKRVIVAAVNASKTWEGFFGSVLSTTLVGMFLWWITPFSYWQAACMSAVIAVMGFAGTMTLSAVKRDRGVKDFGTLVEGHAGVLDRIDSLCFAAPVFFHLTRFFFAKL